MDHMIVERSRPVCGARERRPRCTCAGAECAHGEGVEADVAGEAVDPAETRLTSCEYARHIPGIVWIGGAPWRSSGGVFRPLCMPHVPVVADRAELHRAVSEHRGLLAYWTSDWDLPGGEWWWTCCDRADYDLDAIESARGRRSIRKGLRECTVRRVEAGDFARPAYPVYRSAVESYGGPVPTPAEYARMAERLAAYPGTELWAAFRGERMAAFATCQIVDNAVILGSTKSDPELHRYNPNAALFYTITRHYLRQGRRYVSNGSRTLWHPTNINEFLLTLGFRRIYCRLNVQLSTVARLIDGSRVVTWGRFLGLARLAGDKWSRLEGFDRLVRIAETFPAVRNAHQPGTPSPDP